MDCKTTQLVMDFRVGAVKDTGGENSGSVCNNSRGPHVLQALTMLLSAGLSSLRNGSRTLSSRVLWFSTKEDVSVLMGYLHFVRRS